MREFKPVIPANSMREMNPGGQNIRTYLHADLSIMPADLQPQTRKRGKYLLETNVSYPMGG